MNCRSFGIKLRKSALKIEAMSCQGCRFLFFSKDQEDHIIRRHFLFEDWRDIKYRESFFFCNLISPQQLFHEVRMKPRFQFRQGGRSGPDRFIYYLSFDFDVGVFPLHSGRNCTTKTVRIVCDCEECPACGLRRPTKIVTMYPVY